MVNFRGIVRREGSTGNLRVAVPIKLGVAAPAWYEAAIGDVKLLVFVRSPRSRPYPTFTLPKWAFPGLAGGQEIDVALAPPERASGQLPGFDWLRLVDDNKCFPTQDGDALVLHSQYEPPFRLHRTPADLAQHYRLLGFYQAEGSKGKRTADWNFASASADLVRAALSMLDAWSIPPARCYIEVLHGPNETPDEARAFFAQSGLEISSVRPRVGAGGHAAILHVRSSSLLLGMTLRALREIFDGEFPSSEAARAYALGWLDGDGSVTIEHSVRLALAGLEDEHLVVQKAFRAAFGWKRRGRGWINNNDGTHIRLRPTEIAQLLEAGAFPYSMNRVKLLLAFDERTAFLREVAATGFPSFRLGYARWAAQHGLVERAPVRGYRLVDAGREVLEAHARLRGEIEAVRVVAPPRGIVRRKGVPYPA